MLHLDSTETFQTIKTGPDTGKLSGYSMVGSYPLFYLDGSSMVLCPSCAQESLALDIRDDDRAVCSDVNWENPSLYCDQCSERIESAYAEED